MRAERRHPTNPRREEFRLYAIGHVRSTLRALDEAPLQGSEGAPDVWLDLDPACAAGLSGIEAGDELIVVTWLHRADRDVLEVHPRGDPASPLAGVFATRSPDRPNPLGLHRVTVREVTEARLRVGPIEAIDGTPVVDLKPVLDGEGSRTTASTRIRRHVDAPRASVYRALLDARAVAEWMVPVGMTSRVHEFEGREGGRFRISLTYDEPTGTGNTTARSDTYHGRFVALVPDERVVEALEFETADAAMQGEMTVTITLTDSGGGTDVLAVHDDLPPGLSPADNETGWRMALDKLAAFVEAGRSEA